MPQEAKTPPWELIVRKCWNPDCPKVATCRDKGGWEWCDDHLDQEKIGGFHALDINLDANYYRERAEEIIKRELASDRQQIVGEITDAMENYIKVDAGKSVAFTANEPMYVIPAKFLLTIKSKE